MTHTYKVHYFHLIWSTKNRKPLITEVIKNPLYAYIKGIFINKNKSLVEIGGMPDHVHLLIKLGNLDDYSSFIRDVKASSSFWIKREFEDAKDFAWQEGFASFTVCTSIVSKVQAYIQQQEKHHKKMTFEEEYIKFLKLHDKDYDRRFVFD